ncbi:hypothetical protein K431DRAFT_281548 [Polychaeton citri CBS 116435]|uniref:Uncharacterized protein n=1 Tax=Polychaeton citri CBS 116435 TaxID=1314669 RepID=A0A9P4QD64_9PEZI|nr:hypothetical protein K431DRAFT_281548 [Polychaeton citri CBS 116435]
MARSPSDATRFTATGPYISNKPASSSSNAGGNVSFSQNPLTPGATSSPSTLSSQIQIGAAPPANETPQQKIARLRAAANVAKLGKESGFDRTVRVGRVWADRAHRVTAITLIGLTVVSGAVATAGITDMLLHNRRRKKEWLAEQQSKSAAALTEAKQALAQGTATQDQMLLINRERVIEAAELERRNAPGAVTRAKNWLFGGLSKEEQKGGRLGAGAGAAAAVPGPTEFGEPQARKQAIEGTKASSNEGSSILQTAGDKLDSHRRQGEKIESALSPLGGPLDQHAQLLTNAALGTEKSWKSWLLGR